MEYEVRGIREDEWSLLEDFYPLGERVCSAHNGGSRN